VERNKRIRVLIPFFIFFLGFSPYLLEARRIKPSLYLSPRYGPMVDRDTGFKELYSRVMSKKRRKGKDNPVFVAFSGETGAGQTTIAQFYAQQFQERGLKTLVVSGDNFIIPKSERVTSLEVDLRKKDREEIGILGIEIRKLEDGKIDVITPTQNYKVEFKEGMVPIWRIPNTEIEIEYQGKNRYIVHLPVFLSKFQWKYYQAVRNLIAGKDAFMPIFDQATRTWMQLSQEELAELDLAQQESLGSYVPLSQLSQETGKDLWVDKNTGIIYERLSPQKYDVIITENVWNLLDPGSQDLYDEYVFVHADQRVRRYNFGVRHILEGRYRKRMLEEIVAESSETWWQQQREFELKQLQIVQDKGGIIVNNSAPLKEGNIVKMFGLELDKRIKKAIEVCREDWDENMEEEEIDPVIMLDYAMHTAILDTPLYYCMEEIVEAIKEGRIKRSGNDREEVEEFLKSIEDFRQLSIYEKALLDYVLKEAGILSPAKFIFIPQWGWDSEEKVKTLVALEKALQEVEEGMPYPVVATVYYVEKAMGKSVLDSFGFKDFAETLLKSGMTYLEVANEIAKVFPYVCHILYGNEKLKFYLESQYKENPRVLILGAGNFSWPIFLYYSINPVQLDGVDRRPLDREVEKNLTSWGLERKQEEGRIRWFRADFTHREELNEVLGDARYDLVILRTPFTTLEDLKKSINNIRDYLSNDGILVLLTHEDELEAGSEVSQAILNLDPDLPLLQIDLYPINPRFLLVPYKMKDKFTILKASDIDVFLRYLEEAE
jgi:uridine kinase/SAM-dependent methyltransferase